jgi:hypothetical protein
VVLSTEERVFLVEYDFREVQKQFAEKFPVTPVTYCNAVRRLTEKFRDSDRPRTLNELKTAITAYIRNISQADLQKVFVNKLKRVQACIDARGHHFQHVL